MAKRSTRKTPTNREFFNGAINKTHNKNRLHAVVTTDVRKLKSQFVYLKQFYPTNQ